MTSRGDIWWADLGPAVGSRPAKRRPVLIISADEFNSSRLRTVVIAAITSNTSLSAMPGNVLLPAFVSNLSKDSVVNVTSVATIDRTELDAFVARVPQRIMAEVDHGLRQGLGL